MQVYIEHEGAFYAYEITDSRAITETEHDAVNHPAHYTSHPSGVECITITEHHNFCIGNAIKYLWRQGLKTGASNIEDLEKAAWYIRREIERIKTEDKAK